MRMYKNEGNGFEQIYDYGIEEFLNKNIDGKVYKMMALIYEDEYAINYGPASSCDHSTLSNEIRREFGDDYDISIGVINRTFDIYKYEDSSFESIDTLKDILLEIKNYYLKNNDNIIIRMNNFDYLDDDEYSCEKIDMIINMLNSLNNVRIKK